MQVKKQRTMEESIENKVWETREDVRKESSKELGKKACKEVAIN